MKKSIAMLLAIVMVFSILPISVFATETGGTITFATNFDNNLGKGDVFTVTATLSDNPGIASFTNMLKWNNEVVKFTGFTRKTTGNKKPISEVFADDSITASDTTGGFAVALDYDNDISGLLYTANFEIIAEEGELGLGLTTTEFGKEFMFADVGGNDIMPALDFSAITGLTVGGKPVGPAIPEDAPFTAITTNVGPIVAIEQWDDLDVDPWGTGYGSPVVHYHITIPADATEAYVRFAMPLSELMSQTDADDNDAIGSAYASVNHVDLGKSAESGMANLYFGDNGDDYTDVIIPVEFTTAAWGGDPEFKNAVMSEDELYYAVGPEDLGANVIAVFSLEYAAEGGEEEETHSITVEQTTGGTVTVYDMNGENEITKAAAGDCLFLENQADTGYTFKHYLINGDVVTQDALGMNNGFYIMPAADITVSAVFEEVAPEIEPNPITKIDLSHPNIVTDDEGNMTMSMVTGASETIDLSYTVQNAELASTQKVFWSVREEDAAVASVDQTGKVTALGAGTAIITAKAVNNDGTATAAEGGEVMAQITLTVADPAAGYAVNMGEDKTVVANETVQIPVTVTHSDPSVTDYKSFEFTFQYDPALLTLKNESSAAEGKDITIVNKNDTITVRRYGNALKVGDAAITLEFTAKAVGNTNVKLITAKVGTSDDAKDENIPTAQIEDNLTEITVSGYTVNLPDEFEGETDKPVVAPGESYTFEAKDKNYTYEVKATIDGVEITVNSNEDGTSFTIPEGEIDGNVVVEIAKKEGKKFEITLKGDSLAHESGYTTEGEKTYAQYMTAYTAKLTEKDHYIYDLKVTVNNAAVEYDYNSETGIITIPGNLITGPVVIESGEKESEKHDVKFEGAYASHAKYEGESAVYNGESFSFTIETPAGLVIESYQVSYKMGDAEEYTTLEANDGTYTVEKVTAALTIKIEGTSDLKVEVNEYVKLNGKTVFLVTATQTLPEGKNLAYDTNVMYLKNFQVEDSDTMEQMYSYLVVVGPNETLSVEDATAMITIVEAQATTLLDTFNVNESSALDINDAQLVYDLYNNVYQDIDIVGMQKFLRADVNGSRNINVSDAAAVVNAILAGNQ